jgi:hypothetical protein
MDHSTSALIERPIIASVTPQANTISGRGMSGPLTPSGRTLRRICDAKTSVRRRDYEWVPGTLARIRSAESGRLEKDAAKSEMRDRQARA